MFGLIDKVKEFHRKSFKICKENIWNPNEKFRTYLMILNIKSFWIWILLIYFWLQNSVNLEWISIQPGSICLCSLAVMAWTEPQLIPACFILLTQFRGPAWNSKFSKSSNSISPHKMNDINSLNETRIWLFDFDWCRSWTIQCLRTKVDGNDSWPMTIP